MRKHDCYHLRFVSVEPLVGVEQIKPEGFTTLRLITDDRDGAAPGSHKTNEGHVVFACFLCDGENAP